MMMTTTATRVTVKVLGYILTTPHYVWQSSQQVSGLFASNLSDIIIMIGQGSVQSYRGSNFALLHRNGLSPITLQHYCATCDDCYHQTGLKHSARRDANWGSPQGELSEWKMSSRGLSGGGCLDPLDDYNSLCVVVVLCATLVNTRTHTYRQKDSFPPAILLVQLIKLALSQRHCRGTLHSYISVSNRDSGLSCYFQVFYFCPDLNSSIRIWCLHVTLPARAL